MPAKKTAKAETKTNRAQTKADAGAIVAYIEKLVKTPSPTGFTAKATEYLVANAKAKEIKYEVTRKGAVIYKFEGPKFEGPKLKGPKPSRRIMLAAHIDTLGAIVKKVEKDFVKFDSVGGYPAEYVVGNYCTIHTFDGAEVPGTILPANPSVHVNKDLKEKKFSLTELVVRVDLKLKNKRDSLENYVQIGNFISLDPGYSFVNGFVKSRHLDDKASAAVLLHIADILVERIRAHGALRDNVYFFFNITEETGQGIAGFPEIDDLLVVDMGAIGEGLSGDELSVSICAKDTTGPYNYDFTHELTGICKKKGINCKMDIFPYYGSDGSGALSAGRDIRVALIGPGVGASHGYERTHIDALSGTGDLILGYILD
jgi:putative aminopeptidase FrvX